VVEVSVLHHVPALANVLAVVGILAVADVFSFPGVLFDISVLLYITPACNWRLCFLRILKN